MTEKFDNLDEQKKKRIIDAALKEFAENGYEQASTNRIVKNAGIGKGMLFYYFKNKKALYHYLIEHAIDVMVNEFFSLIDTEEPDFIKRFKQIARVKMRYYYDHPNVSSFIGTVLLDDTTGLPADLQSRLADLEKAGYAMMYENVDPTLFRDDINPEKAFQLIRWSIEGYQNELMNQFKGQKLASIDFEPYWDEFYEYLDVLRTVFYNKKGDAT